MLKMLKKVDEKAMKEPTKWARVTVKTHRIENEKTQSRQPRSLRTPNKCGRSLKWSQINRSKTSEHKYANENQ